MHRTRLIEQKCILTIYNVLNKKWFKKWYKVTYIKAKSFFNLGLITKINQNRASCIECGKDCEVPSGSTTGMRSHFKTKHKTSFETLVAKGARVKAISKATTFDVDACFDSDNNYILDSSSSTGLSRAATVRTPARKRSRKEQISGDVTPAKRQRVFTKSQGGDRKVFNNSTDS
nr:uncharacterized protein LOC124807981 [Hydra vulgaris]